MTSSTDFPSMSVPAIMVFVVATYFIGKNRRSFQVKKQILHTLWQTIKMRVSLLTFAWCLSWWMRRVSSPKWGSRALYAYGRGGKTTPATVLISPLALDSIFMSTGDAAWVKILPHQAEDKRKKRMNMRWEKSADEWISRSQVTK